MIDKNKQYKTRDGREVRIYATDGSGSLPVHGAINHNYGWEPYSWRDNGSSYLTDKPEDLIEVRPRIQREVWVNVYPFKVSSGYDDKKHADLNALQGRIACARVMIDCFEGDGL